MNTKRTVVATLVFSVAGVCGAGFLPACFASVVGQEQVAGQPAVARRIGAIKTINGNAITLTPDSGPDVAVTVQANARILRIAVGEEELKNAAPVPLQAL